ncbi:hypothetical protein [Marinicella meishanensis]|uniref:hypothetical protein n=1 Tax=Marinicella meishanensis TaxID=2873263 RepID=UPI001CBAA8E4|nr:hypothetical protein [Marinicella sp. NBU2979]
MHSLQETIWENVSNRPLKQNMVGKYYRLTEWPNFGFSKYSPDFIVLSAHLTKKTMSKSELLQLVNGNEHIVNHFLNAASLLQIIELKEGRENLQRDSGSAVSHFTNRLKSLFGFSS